MKTIKEHYLMLGLICLVFFIHLGILSFVLTHPERAYVSDSGHYDFIAQQLVKQHRFSGPAVLMGGKTEEGAFQGLSFADGANVSKKGAIPDSFRTPFYPAYLALIYGLFGPNLSVVLFLQIVISLWTSVIVYKISTTLFNQSVGILTFLIVSCSLGFLAYPNYVLTETWFVFLLTFSVWYMVRFLHTGKPYFLLLSALFAGLSALCRPVALYFPVVFLLVLLVKDRKSLKTFFPHALIYISVFLGVLSPWFIRNYVVFERVCFTSLQGYNVFFLNVAFMKAEKTGVYWEMERKNLINEVQQIVDERQLNSMEASLVTQKLAFQRITADLATYVRVHLKGMIKMFITHNLKTFYSLVTDRPYHSGSALSVFFETGSLRKAFSAILDASSPVAVIVLLIMFIRGFLYGFLLYGAYKALRTHSLVLLLFLLIIGYFVAVTGPLGAEPRFRVPIIPFVTILSSYGIVEFVKVWKKHPVLQVTTPLSPTGLRKVHPVMEENVGTFEVNTPLPDYSSSFAVSRPASCKKPGKTNIVQKI